MNKNSLEILVTHKQYTWGSNKVDINPFILSSLLAQQSIFYCFCFPQLYSVSIKKPELIGQHPLCLCQLDMNENLKIPQNQTLKHLQPSGFEPRTITIFGYLVQCVSYCNIIYSYFLLRHPVSRVFNDVSS